MTYQELNRELGNIDIYLLDAILKGRFAPGVRILDAGCGEGRNLHWFIKNNYDVWACDSNASAIRMLQYTARSLNPKFDKNRFIVAGLETLPYPDQMFDAIICSAVLHFAENEQHFKNMWAQLYRALKPEGILFVRLASDFGLEGATLEGATLESAAQEGAITETTDGKFLLPDGSLRYLLRQELLDTLLKEFPCQLVEPLKSVLVHNARSMTTLVLQKTNNSAGV